MTHSASQETQVGEWRVFGRAGADLRPSRPVPAVEQPPDRVYKRGDVGRERSVAPQEVKGGFGTAAPIGSMATVAAL
jgi:hypothetical protein